MSDKADHNTQFTEVLEALNPAQRLAVDRIEGPVLVVAGPGTGKTHILAARVGHILERTDAQPYNILCLTFSDAGVQAMRRRLLSFIGPTAHRIHIFTFHSFCNKIIQENLSLFGRHYLEPLDELERIDVVRGILDRLPADHLMRRTTSDGYFYENHLYDLFRRMKQEGWNEAYVLQRIDTYVEDLPNRKYYRYQRNSGDNVKGDLNEGRYRKEVNRMELLRAGVPLFSAYQEELARRGRYDFEDMILWVLDAFRNYPSLLRTYQEQYLYVLVDEYQDTNGAQNQVLRSLIAYWNQPNVFIVGDDDQSIYEFQGARLKNLTDFYQAYAGDMQTVVLRENYRSTPAILDLAGGLIEINEKRLLAELSELGLEKKLSAAGAFRESEVQPEIVTYEQPLHEVAGIVAAIEDQLAAGVPADEIAVIYAKHSQAELLIDVLMRKGIPFQLRRRPNAMDSPVLQRVRLLLTFLSAERQRPGSGDAHLFRLLHYPVWGIEPESLARLNLARRTDPEAYRIGLRLWITTWLEEEDDPVFAPLRGAITILDQLLQRVDAGTLPRLVEEVYNEVGFVARAMADTDQEQSLSALYSFLDFVRTQSWRNPRLGLEGLLDLLRRMDANGIALPLHELLPPAAGVQLTTAHGSKGLEFRSVFVMDCNKNSWEPKSSAGRFRFSFPDTLTFSGEEDATEARRRLFYVAITRAKEQLQISYSLQQANGRSAEHTRFVDELRESGVAVEREGQPDPGYLRDLRLLMLNRLPERRVGTYSSERIDKMLEGFALSVSSLYTYLRCPLSFFYEHVLKVPRLQSEAASFGTAMHNSLQWLFERMLAHADRQFPQVSELIDHFSDEMERYRAWFRPEVFQQRLELGTRYLREQYKEGLQHWVRNARVEVEIRQAEWEGVPIRGVIDKIEYLPGDRVRLVDYKTGRYDSKQLKLPDPKKPEGGPYGRQLVFYKMLFESIRSDAKVAATGQITYLEPDVEGVYRREELTLGHTETEVLGSLLREVYDRIRAHDFAGCEQERCSWCRFEREHVHPDLRIAPPEEALDDPF